MERLGREPDPEKAPLEMGDFPAEVQYAFSIYNLLPDRWDGMNGIYLGKDWAPLGALFDIYNIDNQAVSVYFIKYMEYYNSKSINDKAEKQRKARDSKASRGTSGTIQVNG
jgi:hypothetical protein